MIPDAVVIGGGAIGCASALALAKRGARVRMFERAHPGAEASSAAAGILGAHIEAHDNGPLVGLCLASLKMYAAWTSALTEATGIDTGHRSCGSMRVYFEATELEHDTRTSVEIFGASALRSLRPDEASALEPNLAPDTKGALSFPADCRIEPPALLRALQAALRKANVSFEPPENAARVVVDRERATGVALSSGEVVHAGSVVVAAGAWSLLEGAGLRAGEIEPIRGQMIELRTDEPLIDRVLFGPGAYLCPRGDCRIVVGSTQERVGFRKAVTVRGIRGLLEGARALIPALDNAEITQTWSGLRPSTPDGAPLLGSGAARGLIVATGHFRNGILLAPVTAEIVASLALGEPPPFDIAPFAVDRFVRRRSPPPAPAA